MHESTMPSPVPPPRGPGPRPRRLRGAGRPPVILVALLVSAVSLIGTMVRIETTGPLLPMSKAMDASARPPTHQYSLPRDPCAGATVDQLRRVSAVLPSTGVYVGTSATCDWSAVFSDGTTGGLEISYRSAAPENSEDPLEAEAAAIRRYRQDTVQFTSDNSHTEVEELRYLPDLGEQSMLVYADLNPDPRTPSPMALVFVRQDNMNLTVTAYDSFEGTEGVPDYRGDEDVLLDIAAQALRNVD
ncbi:hypothetical protein ACFONH_11675 [Streptomonospora nanhaiensis]|uniref:hypothetical protein n=1 Tax=Streptomonospora nanhaiensis TaxID=1323731 RepID=UPI001C9938BC|nr:hypothetical protein [Streptomonospora nanhaiensis]MBX9387825.1 hypothetical protein [Streptomonospora nanhaiensis]